jgi:hypothetical protein
MRQRETERPLISYPVCKLRSSFERVEGSDCIFIGHGPQFLAFNLAQRDFGRAPLRHPGLLFLWCFGEMNFLGLSHDFPNPPLRVRPRKCSTSHSGERRNASTTQLLNDSTLQLAPRQSTSPVPDQWPNEVRSSFGRAISCQMASMFQKRMSSMTRRSGL